MRGKLNLSMYLVAPLLWLGLASYVQAAPMTIPKMYFSDTSRIGRPFAKDPSVIRFKNSYWMYYSLPAATSGPAVGSGWGIGIARSSDLIHWTKVGELTPEQEIEKPGIAAPDARVLNGRIELFYQTYGGGRRDAICHATSTDGIHFDRDSSNPVYRPTRMAWSVGRAIDANVYPDRDKLWLFFATRDPSMKIQELGMAAALLGSGYGRDTWHDVSVKAPILKPELPWEKTCIESPAVLSHGKRFYLFYAGAYDNAPQQIGVAVSSNGKNWVRQSGTPLLANGAPGSWNSSESGHPDVFTDNDGRTYLFYQGNNDNGQTWFLSMLEIRWHGKKPYLIAP